MKLFLASLLLFFCSKKWFDGYVRKNFEEDYNLSNFEDSTDQIRKKLRCGLRTNLIVFILILSSVWWFYPPDFKLFDAFKVLAAYLAMTVTIGRGGWAIQTYKGVSLPERIDNTIYKLAQYTNITILLVTIYHPK